LIYVHLWHAQHGLARGWRKGVAENHQRLMIVEELHVAVVYNIALQENSQR
jgi:hypothetical protein